MLGMGKFALRSKRKLLEDFYKAVGELNMGYLVKMGWRRSWPS